MSKVVRISMETFRRIQQLAVPLEDTPDSVIGKLLDFYERNAIETSGQNKEYMVGPKHLSRERPREKKEEAVMTGLKSLSDLAEIELPTKIKPQELIMNGKVFRVSHWTEVCVRFVEWLVDNGYLTEAKCPVPNSAEQGKYFINTKAEHRIAEKDAAWKYVSGFYVDTKYWINAHTSNLAFALKYLNARDVKVELRLK